MIFGKDSPGPRPKRMLDQGASEAKDWVIVHAHIEQACAAVIP
jgi:hypothetical protein